MSGVLNLKMKCVCVSVCKCILYMSYTVTIQSFNDTSMFYVPDLVVVVELVRTNYKLETTEQLQYMAVATTIRRSRVAEW
jgi:hypothetical protein